MSSHPLSGTILPYSSILGYACGYQVLNVRGRGLGSGAARVSRCAYSGGGLTPAIRYVTGFGVCPNGIWRAKQH